MLEGAGIADVFICPSRKARLTETYPDAEYGMTLRLFNPSTKTWSASYGYGRGGDFVNLSVKLEGEKLVLSQVNSA